jgi:hypothetical protein
MEPSYSKLVGDQEAERFVLTCLRFEITPGKTYEDIRMPLQIDNFERQKGTNRWVWVTGRLLTKPSQTCFKRREHRSLLRGEADSDLHRRSDRKDRARREGCIRSGDHRGIRQVACPACRAE